MALAACSPGISQDALQHANDAGDAGDAGQPAGTPASGATPAPGTTPAPATTPAPGATPGTDPATPMMPPGTQTPPQTAKALSTKGNQIVDAAGKPVILHGLNWYGFDNQQSMVEGLWNGDALAGDFATIVLRLRALGFNTIRLPFSFKDLAGVAPKPFSRACTLPTLAEVAQSAVAPGAKAPALTALPAPPKRAAGMCNDYLPQDSTRHRFIWTVQFLAHNGFYVVIDDHMRTDTTVLDNAAAWASAWGQLVADLVQGDTITQNHLIVDILNEPDNMGLRWEPAAGKPGMIDLYQAAIAAIEPKAPVLYFVEGTGQSGIEANWGDGFDTNPADIKSLGISDPTPFFTSLAKSKYANRVVISPHVYGPAVTTNPMGATGPALIQRLSQSFGYLTQKGFCSGSSCQVLPVAVGEFGSKFVDPGDLSELEEFLAYCNATGAGADMKHAPIHSWIYWCYNPTSADTGGIVGDDWRTLDFKKIAYLQKLGL